jgi:hypothetical protein
LHERGNVLPRCGFPYRLATPIPRQKRHAHPHCRSGETRVERDGWIGQFSHNALITKPAALGYVRIFDWEKDIRLMIEQSNVVPDAVFCTWDTQFTNKHEWASFLGSSYFFSTDQCRASKLGLGDFIAVQLRMQGERRALVAEEHCYQSKLLWRSSRPAEVAESRAFSFSGSMMAGSFFGELTRDVPLEESPACDRESVPRFHLASR